MGAQNFTANTAFCLEREAERRRESISLASAMVADWQCMREMVAMGSELLKLSHTIAINLAHIGVQTERLVIICKEVATRQW
jgi:hypothetical protein